MNQTVNPRLSHFSFIDSLRGSAAFIVAFFHIFSALTGKTGENVSGFNHVLYRLMVGDFDLGKYAVGVFFMVSGFLIPSTLEASQSLKTFVIHRFFRLYPAYWFSIFVFLFLSVFVRHEITYSTTDVFFNVSMFQGFFHRPDVNGAYWTLQIELTFYLLCALLFYFKVLHRRGLWVVVFLIVAMAGSVVRVKFGKSVPEAMFIALALMFSADALRHKDRLSWLYFILCALTLIPISRLAYGPDANRYMVTYWVALLTFWLVFQSNPATWHRTVPVVLLADMSYSLYLLHGPIGIDLAKHLNHTGMSLWPSLVLGLTAAMFTSYLVYRYIEAPAIAYSRRLAPTRARGTSGKTT